ncbi:MAG: hypothetical protein NTNFB02_15870 [Nitrospira sp.]
MALDSNRPNRPKSMGDNVALRAPVLCYSSSGNQSWVPLNEECDWGKSQPASYRGT